VGVIDIFDLGVDGYDLVDVMMMCVVV